MATSANALLGDSLFQVNLLLWMLQPPNTSGIRPLLAEAGYRLRSIEEPLPLSPDLINRLNKASIKAKDNASADVIVNADDDEHLLIECKANMFGATPPVGASDSNQRQARSFLLQTPNTLKSALAGAKVSSASLAYLTRHNPKHKQDDGLIGLGKELKAAKLSPIPSSVWRLTEHNGGIAMLAPAPKEKWPTRLRAACKTKRGSKTITVIPRDESGNDIRPLYIIPWMPESEPQPDAYNRRAFGNRLLSAAVVRVGRTPVGDDAILNFDELLEETTLSVYAKWRNKDAKRSLKDCARKLIGAHLKGTGALTSDPYQDGQSVLIKISDEKIKGQIIKAFRETIDTKWDEPDAQGELPFGQKPEEKGKTT
jgi:hypothetical protein